MEGQQRVAGLTHPSKINLTGIYPHIYLFYALHLTCTKFEIAIQPEVHVFGLKN